MQETVENAPKTRPTRALAAGPEGFGTAGAALRAGALVAFPTETVYGLGADARQSAAVADLYAAKGRPAFNPLIVHVADLAQAQAFGRFDATARALAARFWPGPLTLVVPSAPGSPISSLATAGLDTVALRVPAHPVAQNLLKAFGGPLVAPSANRSGHVSPTEARHVRADLEGRIDLVIDGGPCPLGIESTIIACLDAPRLLRPGALTREDIEMALGLKLIDHPTKATDRPAAPGMLEQHYAPRAAVRLNATTLSPGEALLAFGPDPLPGAPATACLNLSPRGELKEAAMHLFDYLRALDTPDISGIAIMPIPETGLGEAIADRLRRAAAPAPDAKARP